MKQKKIINLILKPKLTINNKKGNQNSKLIKLNKSQITIKRNKKIKILNLKSLRKKNKKEKLANLKKNYD